MWGGLVFPPLEEFSTVCCEPHKGFGRVNKAEVCLEFSCFFDDLAIVDNLISSSSAFSKSSLNIWKFSAHILLKPGLENFEHYFASMWDECHCVVVEHTFHCLSLGLEWNPSPVATAELSRFAAYECSTFTASSFRMWNSSTRIPSPPLALFVVMLPKVLLTLNFRMSGSRWVITHCGYPSH